MVHFLDGPAKGKTLMLRRIPIYLRVVQGEPGGFDALDQLDDTARPTECITVYKRRDDLEINKYHIPCRRGRGGANPTGWYWNASYSELPNQPLDSEVRSNAAWQAWAQWQTKESVKQ